MIEEEHEVLSIKRQCELLGKSRSWYYYTPGKAVKRSAADTFYTELIKQVSDVFPFYGYRKIALELNEQYSLELSFKEVYRLWQEEGLHAVHIPIPTSTPRTAHAVYPYLLGKKEITYPNQAWQVDITYLRLPHGSVFLCAIIDVYSRKVLSWNLSNTMDVYLVLWALTWALERYGAPEIINSDQGSQFTTNDWISMVEDLAIKISMTGRGRSLDNIFIERWWRSFKHEHFYLQQYQTVRELRKGISSYVEFYNTRRFHQSLDYKRPDEVFYEKEELIEKESA